jgi:hypothetical protein
VCVTRKGAISSGCWGLRSALLVAAKKREPAPLQRAWEREVARRVEAGASQVIPRLGVGMTAPATSTECWGRSYLMDMPASPIKMAPARGSAPRPSKVFPFQIARRSSGYPSGVPIEAGKRGNVCSVLNRTWKNIELPARVGALLGTCVVAESRIHRSRGSVETNREKVAAPAISSQSTGAVSSSLAQTLLLI